MMRVGCAYSHCSHSASSQRPSSSAWPTANLSSFYAMERRWPLPIIAAIIGFATATRAVGVTLLAPFAIYIWYRSSDPRRFVRKLWLFPLACLGVVAYMLYLYVQFGDPLAFAKTQ